jgi:hypothetical protein
MLRIVADLIPLFDSSRGSRVIVAGDLNMSMATKDPYYLRRATGILGALESLGLKDATEVAKTRPAPWLDCPCGANGACRHLRTWQNQELDHAYVTESLIDDVFALDVRQDAVDAGLSDHAPIVIDLALNLRPVARQWDRDTVPAEMGRLLGDPARRIVERLIGWAEDKERRVGQANRKGVILTRLPGSRSIVPEIWFQIDFPGQDLPMYTVSVRGDGQVVVQFQWMLYPPFDNEEGRRSLLDQLNAIADVELDPNRLNGRPSFSLMTLQDVSAFDSFVAVLERIVDETRPTRAIDLGAGPNEGGVTND